MKVVLNIPDSYSMARVKLSVDVSNSLETCDVKTLLDRAIICLPNDEVNINLT